MLLRIAFFGGLLTLGLASDSSRSLSANQDPLIFSEWQALNPGGAIPDYLIPTTDRLCQDGSCCNSDYLASPYRLQHLNSSLWTIGQQVMTTFYMKISSDAQLCVGYAGADSCCTADISKVWLDVDPTLKVEYFSLGGKTSNFVISQDQYGMSLDMPADLEALSIPTTGMMMTVTVSGNATTLCAPPEYLLGLTSSFPPICQIITQGAAPGGRPNSCCPYGLGLPVNPAVAFPATLPQCIEAIESTPFSVQLESVSTPALMPSYAMLPMAEESENSVYSNFTFTVTASGACDAAAINACCGITISGVQFTIANSAVNPSVPTFFSLRVDGQPSVMLDQDFVRSGAYMVFTARGLGLAPGSPPATIVMTLLLAQSSTQLPEICSQGTPSSDTVGSCYYELLPDASSPGSGMCCPASTTAAVAPSLPTFNPGTCAPAVQVPLRFTTMGFSYFEGPVALPATDSQPTSTRFTFMVYNNATDCARRTYCQDMCSWELLVNPEMLPLMSFESDLDSGSNGVLSVQPGPNSTVTFKAPPPGETVSYFIIVAKPAATLEDLCNAMAALGQQFSAPCAAVLRSPVVYVTVPFSSSDVAIPPSSSRPPSPAAAPAETAICLSGNALSGSCVRVINATRSSASPLSAITLLDFKVENQGLAASGGCSPDEAIMSFQVVLTPQAAAELQASKAIMPSSALFGGSLGTVAWTYTPMEDDIMHYQLSISGGARNISSICAQNTMLGQPANTCVVTFTGASTCYSGWITFTEDPYLQPIPVSAPAAETKTNVAAITAGIIVPLFVLAAVAAGVFAFRRRRRNEQQAVGAEADDRMAALHPEGQNSYTSSTSAYGMDSRPLIAERAPSDVFIRLPAS